mmetsp:Transcript_29393/g.78986  ORF Transcript_29393/g.78986 Transcript_29393/m.78986 type:complete len:487 (+) Transcript_29393:1-1461(+)
MKFALDSVVVEAPRHHHQTMQLRNLAASPRSDSHEGSTVDARLNSPQALILRLLCADLLAALGEHISAPDEDALAFALACTRFRDALKGRTLRTRKHALVSSLARLKWAERTFGAGLFGGSVLDPDILSAAVESGSVEVLDRLGSGGYALALGDRGRRLCARAAACGHLHILRWLRDHGAPWDAETTAQAAGGGHLQVLAAARDWGCPWNERTSYLAASNGHLDVLRWARQNHCPWDEFTCAEAARTGHLAVLQWAQENGCKMDASACAGAASHGHLDVLQWARRRGFFWDTRACAEAASGGHLDVLAYLHANGCEFDEATCQRAAAAGELQVLQWAHARGCPWDTAVTQAAAYNGDLTMLRWACEAGAPCDETTCAIAAGGGHLEVLQYLHLNGCPWDALTTNLAARQGRMAVLQWALAHDCPVCPGRAAREAAASGALEVLVLLFNTASMIGAMDLDLVRDVAHKQGQAHVEDWVRQVQQETYR